MTHDVSLQLTADQAIVLFEWLAVANGRGDLSFADPAEQRVLWDLEATLESVLVAPLRDDYSQQLQAARQRVRDVLE
jgi:hypothetical protein